MNQHVSDYKIVSRSNMATLEQEVKQLLKEGWEPLGGLTAAPTAEAVLYVQAMIRRSNKHQQGFNLHQESDTELGLE